MWQIIRASQVPFVRSAVLLAAVSLWQPQHAVRADPGDRATRPADWEEFTPAAGAYLLRLPSQPAAIPAVEIPTDGKPFKIFQFGTPPDQRGVSYAVGYINPPLELIASLLDDQRHSLKFLTEMFSDMWDWKVVESRDLTIGAQGETFPGFEQTIEMPAGGYVLFCRQLNAGELAAARRTLDEIVDESPRDAAVLNDRAWLLATFPNARFRDGAQAVHDAHLACELSEWQEPTYVDTLAAAHAEAGDFDQALEFQRRVVEAIDKLPAGDRNEAGQRLKMFERGQAYHAAPNLDTESTWRRMRWYLVKHRLYFVLAEGSRSSLAGREIAAVLDSFRLTRDVEADVFGPARWATVLAESTAMVNRLNQEQEEVERRPPSGPAPRPTPASGSGSRGASRTNCRTCHGTGRCQLCGGTGYRGSCSTCSGTGRVRNCFPSIASPAGRDPEYYTTCRSCNGTKRDGCARCGKAGRCPTCRGARTVSSGGATRTAASSPSRQPVRWVKCPGERGYPCRNGKVYIGARSNIPIQCPHCGGRGVKPVDK